jgi:hypothetical protein
MNLAQELNERQRRSRQRLLEWHGKDADTMLEITAQADRWTVRDARGRTFYYACPNDKVTACDLYLQEIAE